MKYSVIIPTLGRSTLITAVNSVINQKEIDWELFVIFDGTTPTLESKGSLYVLSVEKQGGAGLVRNVGIEKSTGDWILFLDDDDWFSPNYMDRVNDLISIHPEIDIFQFTYKDVSNGNTRPTPGLGHYPRLGEMGISFAVRSNFIKENKILFRKISCEDFHFLNDCVSKGAKYFNTDELLYFVGRRGAWQ